MPGTLFLWPYPPVTEVRGDGNTGPGEAEGPGHTRPPVPVDEEGEGGVIGLHLTLFYDG